MNAGGRNPDEIDVERPSAARIYDYLLGGYHNFEADRVVAERFRELLPSMPLYMQANRAFLRRVVRYLTDSGIDQFLDLGKDLLMRWHAMACRSDLSRCRWGGPSWPPAVLGLSVHWANTAHRPCRSSRRP